ncbi:hypothetical protein [Aquibium sp. ELW1220]|uniref:hypothetical protein n=1 Tax=Aquibium sp. ELW1220 TaxID=2976766 RepID=UPI0025AFAD3D|nr:hypothetical protein [Aquibium sp. ELW1220]MDN2579193.1 hypothetical protein [Aquibium sp. ELW1220]
MAEDMDDVSPDTASKRVARSRVSNGNKFAEGLDGRTKWGRRYRDLCESYAEDLGGIEGLSASQLSLLKRASALTVEIERAEASFSENGDTRGPSADDLKDYQTACNSLRRLLESLGLSRNGKLAPRDPDPFTFEGEGVRLTRITSGGVSTMSHEGKQLARMLAFGIAHAVATNAKVAPALAEFAASIGRASIDTKDIPDGR